MVAGSLKKPWAGPAGLREFGDEYWCPGTGEDAWLEQEFCCGEFGGLREGFAGKDRAGKGSDDEEDFLYIEEIPVTSPRRSMSRMRKDQATKGPVKCPKRKGSKTPTKGGKKSGEESGGTPQKPSETPAASGAGGSSGAASGSGAGGSPGGSGGGGGKKTPPTSSPAKSPAKKRKRGRKGTTAEDKEDEGGSQTVEEAAADAGANPSISTDATVSTLTRVTADKVALRKTASEREGESSVAGPSTAAPPSQPILPPAPQEKDMTENKGFKKYYCNQDCRCNSMTKEELRKAISEASTGDHQYECLHFIRWCETKKELQLLRSEVKESNDKTEAQHKLLEEIAANAKEAAIIRRSTNEYISDKAALGIPWSDMDYACHAFETVEKQQSFHRVLQRVVYGKDCHYCTEAMLDLFLPKVARRVYPLEAPPSHTHVDRVFFYGREYHIMPRIVLHSISRVMAEILPSLKGSAGKAQESLKKNLNETRKASKAEDHKKFRGRLNIPFYLLLWRDTHSGVYAIQEEAPFDGTQQEKAEYVSRWQAIVDDAIADKYAAGYNHPPA